MQKISAFFINFIAQYFYVKHGCRILGEHSPLFFNTSKNLLKLKKKVITFEALYSSLIFQEFLSLFWNTWNYKKIFLRNFYNNFRHLEISGTISSGDFDNRKEAQSKRDGLFNLYAICTLVGYYDKLRVVPCSCYNISLFVKILDHATNDYIVSMQKNYDSNYEVALYTINLCIMYDEDFW